MTRKMRVVAGLAFAAVASCVAAVNVEGATLSYTFTSGSTLTDGRASGSTNPGGGSGFDTVSSWTWYTANSTAIGAVSTLPFGAGTATVGEQQIRVGSGLELQTSNFLFGWGGAGTAIALRGPVEAVDAGSTTVSWTASAGGTNLKGYYSQNGGSSWTPFVNGTPFTIAAGNFEAALVGNDGVDSNTALTSVTIVTPVPEPTTIALAGLATPALLLRRRRRA